jgi:hypothetical protein
MLKQKKNFSPIFELSYNRNLQVTPSASPKEATLPSVNSDIMFNKKVRSQNGYKTED